jgi:DNA-binding response OmpR family regulator
MMRIAILDDDAELCTHIGQLMRKAGHTVLELRSGQQMLKELRQESFDLLLLDWELPDLSGLEILKWARANLDPPPPVIMITARIGEADIVAGLTSGADDYVTKPVQDSVLVARVEAVLRRANPRAPTRGVETYGEHVFDIAAGVVRVSGEAITVTAKEFALALMLFRNLHRPLSRGHLLQTVWGRNPDLATRTLDAHISRIRTALSLRPDKGVRLSSIYSFGYRLERVDNLNALQTDGPTG